jgi:phage terminase small subunit
VSDESIDELAKLSFNELLLRLNTREQQFVHVFDGNASRAAELAGYSGVGHALAVQGSRLMRKAVVRLCIAKRTESDMERFILLREERQELWSRIAVDESEETADRLKALELLGKSQADFTERLEVKGELTLPELVRESMGKS